MLGLVKDPQMTNVWVDLIAQWVHVLAATFWFGSTPFVTFVLMPVVSGLPADVQVGIGERLEPAESRVLRPAAVVTIVTGILRGTVWGPIRSVHYAVSTTYGITWIVALVGTLAIFVFAELLILPNTRRLREVAGSSPAEPDARGGSNRSADQLLATLKWASIVELGGFFGILTCMMVLPFSERL